ncbi:MAG: Hpt domain-containing protein [Rhodospirillales bacterium]|nr:Hpt domain-containing protein [Rhodospirillales bacterium]
MGSGPESLENKLAELKRAYLAALPSRIEEMVQVAASIEASLSSPGCLADLKTLEHLAHKFAGSGGSFGFPDISETAEVVETAAKAMVESGTPPSPDQWQTVKDKLDSLRSAIDDAVSLKKT